MSRFAIFEPDKISRFHDIPFLTKIADVTFYVTFRDIFKILKIQQFLFNDFRGWVQLSEIESSRAEPTAPGPARARPNG